MRDVNISTVMGGRAVRRLRVALGARRATAPARSPARSVAQAFLAVAAVSVAARLAVPIPGTPVPVTLQDLAVLLTGVILGPARGASAVLAYVGLGALGAPVFSGGRGGLAWLAGPTGGYLIAYPAACWVAGWAARAPLVRPRLLGGLLLAQAVIFAGGVSQFLLLTGQTMEAVVAMTVIPFLPGAAIKTGLVLGFVEVRHRSRSTPRS